jgi:hypothetical protein
MKEGMDSGFSVRMLNNMGDGERCSNREYIKHLDSVNRMVPETHTISLTLMSRGFEIGWV